MNCIYLVKNSGGRIPMNSLAFAHSMPQIYTLRLQLTVKECLPAPFHQTQPHGARIV